MRWWTAAARHRDQVHTQGDGHWGNCMDETGIVVWNQEGRVICRQFSATSRAQDGKYVIACLLSLFFPRGRQRVWAKHLTAAKLLDPEAPPFLGTRGDAACLNGGVPGTEAGIEGQSLRRREGGKPQRR